MTDENMFDGDDLFGEFVPPHCDTPIDELLDEPDDERMLHGLYLKITSRFYDPDFDPTMLSTEERVVSYVCYSQALIDNGGLVHFFEHGIPSDPTLGDTVDAYERIGNHAAAEAMRKALAVVPDVSGSPELGVRYRERITAEVWEANDTAFYTADTLPDTRMHSRSERLLAAYVRKNRKVFEHLD